MTSRSEASPPGGWLDTITKRAGLKGGETPTERGWLGEKLKAEVGGGCHTLGTDPVGFYGVASDAREVYLSYVQY